ncbi:MAG: lytic transglycosylase [Gammaproteobacteria bacterium]|nr:lytic transglycosylase [Gammaproteobacteria bacterium]|tara:strand:+ start:295 stop:1788 length:1494 start_codon:yes stop_codon:yes gene_type:complete
MKSNTYSIINKKMLIKKLLLMFTIAIISSCEFPSLIRADQYIEPIAVKRAEKTQNFVNVWERIKFNKTSKDSFIDEKTLEYINYYLKNPNQLNALLEKGRYFIFFVLEELERYRLPPELALLPYIESNYDPFSISSSGAMGMWQFMPATARIYGLKDTWWYEQRHDPLLSSKAAVKYLAYLHNRFNNEITYTLSAYNGGPTLLEKQIKVNERLGKSTNYQNLNLPRQTKEYVPKFKAIVEIIINAKNYDIRLPDFPNEPVLGSIELDGQVEILAFSEFANLKPEFVYKLNAGYTKWASPPGEKTTFIIPIHLEKDLNFKKDNFIQTNQINWVTHKVSKGDSLWKISRKYDTEVNILKKVNYLSSNTLNLNQDLLIPLSNDSNQAFIPYQAHIISEGDTLWSLGRKYNIPYKEIAKNNKLKINSPLTIGRELNIGNRNIHRTINSKKRTILYSVKQGDSLYRIADIFNIEISDIKKINELKNNEISPGQVLKIIIRAF